MNNCDDHLGLHKCICHWVLSFQVPQGLLIALQPVLLTDTTAVKYHVDSDTFKSSYVFFPRRLLPHSSFCPWFPLVYSSPYCFLFLTVLLYRHPHHLFQHLHLQLEHLFVSPVFCPRGELLTEKLSSLLTFSFS